jgi:hypothetical protein
MEGILKQWSPPRYPGALISSFSSWSQNSEEIIWPIWVDTPPPLSSGIVSAMEVKLMPLCEEKLMSLAKEKDREGTMIA